MREGQFIKQNIERWKSYEEEEAESPDDTARRFTYLVDDLSYAKTFYPFSNTVKYINGLAAKMYLSIYRNKKQKSHRIFTFWKTELPLILRGYQKTLLYTFLFFAAFIALGVFSASKDETFIRAILGDGYVDMTEHNIASGDPFGVYKSGNEITMFIQIAFNNISVSFYCFAMGILASVGTLYVLFKNGLMLGVFEYMFFHHHLGFKSVLVIFTHGTLEISAIVIAGCAGIGMGNALLFPKTYTRMQSLKMAAKNSVKIVVSLVPVFLVAVFFEGFVTRHTEVPVAVSLLILASSLSFIIWYYVIYPIRVSNRQKNEGAAI